MNITKQQRRARRAIKTRAKIRELGVARLTVHRTPRHIYAQLFASDGSKVRAAASTVQKPVAKDLKYTGYIEKQNRDVDRVTRYEGMLLPEDLNYANVRALSFEARQTLNKHRPQTLGQASRLSGMTPAAISLLLVYLKKGRINGFAASSGPTVEPTAH